MAVLCSSSKGRSGSSSSNSKSLRSTDVSDLSLGGSRRLRLSVLPTRPKAKPRKGCTTKRRHDVVKAVCNGCHKVQNMSWWSLVSLQLYIGTCILHHIDFTAKKTDVADVPDEMFFAELTTIKAVRCVKFCKCMGPKNSISGDKNNGCRYCSTHNVQHPRGGGFMTGRAG
ncbi:hypothetical protein MKX01_032811 [Papaver californicum]|nr:hypothetical protein MKX01_032811 [Papaver californicum]